MAENQEKLEQAKKVFESLVNMLDTRDWKYDKDEEDLTIHSGVNGDDLPINFIMKVDAEREVIQLISKLPFKMSEEKRIDGAIAICGINYKLVNGCFDYSVEEGTIYFRLTTSFMSGSVLSDDLFEYMIMVSANTIDDYNDKLLMLSKGVLTIDQVIES